MSEQIKVGDLVQIVRGHKCGVERVGGMIYTVLDFSFPRNGGWYCPICKMRSAGGDEPQAMGLYGKYSRGVPVSWLKKINPPATEETRETDREVTA